MDDEVSVDELAALIIILQPKAKSPDDPEFRLHWLLEEDRDYLVHHFRRLAISVCFDCSVGDILHRTGGLLDSVVTEDSDRLESDPEVEIPQDQHWWTH